MISDQKKCVRTGESISVSLRSTFSSISRCHIQYYINPLNDHLIDIDFEHAFQRKSDEKRNMSICAPTSYHSFSLQNQLKFRFDIKYTEVRQRTSFSLSSIRSIMDVVNNIEYECLLSQEDDEDEEVVVEHVLLLLKQQFN